MNFYIDFEATQFSQEIISIGCVAENDNTFNCLVCPHDLKNVTPFITELTGISRELLEDQGLSAEVAFYRLYEFVKENNGDDVPVYYCYGNSDKDFIRNTVKHMRNLNMIIFASSVQAMLVDYSNTVKNYLSTRGLSLKKLAALIRHADEVEQNHNALDDAIMLKECFEGLDTLEKSIPAITVKKPTECNNEFQKAYQQIIDKNGLLTPIKMQGVNLTQQDKVYLKKLRLEDWGQIPAEDVPGDATEENYGVKLTNIKKGFVKYFSTPIVAAMFFNGYVLNSRSPKETKVLNSTMKEMGRNPNNFCGYRCELRMNDIETKEEE